MSISQRRPRTLDRRRPRRGLWAPWRLVVPILLVVVGLLVVQTAALALAPVGVPVSSAAVPDPPEVSAKAWILYDDTFGLVLAEHNADDVRSIASTTKMMTAILAIEQGTLDDVVRVSSKAAGVGESEVGLEAGERLSLRQLVTALMIRSANDASIAVAEHVGGSVDGFVAMMNEKAIELGMTNTSFANPHGLDAPNHHSSARDLLTLALYAMQDPLFAELAHTRRAVLPEDSSGRIRVAAATNRLLASYEGALGIKTGYTDGAGLALVAAAKRGDRVIYAIVLGSDDHFADATALLNHGFADYRLYAAISAGAQYGVRRAPEGEDTPAFAVEDVEVLGEPNVELTVLPELRDGIPVLVARLGDEEVGTTAMETTPLPDLPTLREAVRWLLDMRFDR